MKIIILRVLQREWRCMLRAGNVIESSCCKIISVNVLIFFIMGSFKLISESPILMIKVESLL